MRAVKPEEPHTHHFARDSTVFERERHAHKIVFGTHIPPSCFLFLFGLVSAHEDHVTVHYVHVRVQSS
jgi:hypothetical protein